MNRFFVSLCAVAVAGSALSVQALADRWTANPDGSIVWNLKGQLPHRDHLEMSGRQVSTIVRYGAEADSAAYLNITVLWPMLRTIPNNTHASLLRRFDWNPLTDLTVNGRPAGVEKLKSAHIDGTLELTATADAGRIGIERRVFPSPTHPMVLQQITLTNLSDKPMDVEVPSSRVVKSTPEAKGVKGAYTIVQTCKGFTKVLAPGESVTTDASIQAYSAAKGESELTPDAAAELAERRNLVGQWRGNLKVHTPNKDINNMFDFSKVRLAESIYETAGGPMHGPGGERYYAAIWTNDQAEYANPLFPFIGYDYGNASALNAYRHFARFMNPEYKPIPSSIIAEGIDIWNGAGDRGDAAMIAYGASRYALARASRAEAEELWPLIEWCLEYCRRQLTSDGVVASDSDELEGRFPSGDANLCTSTLYYDALLSASHLARELGKPAKVSSTYASEAKTLRAAIEKHFGADMKGFHAYKYYDGNDKLRSWISMPLVVGIFDRADGTIDALTSPYLWTDNGLLTEEGSKTFWDRSTLYTLRGVYHAGHPDKAQKLMDHYSHTRLLGEHVPYAIEAWPEGNQRHLSAESALYARVITEGLFGIRPTGFSSFDFKPSMPSDWNDMSLSDIHAFGTVFSIDVKRLSPSKLQVEIKTPKRTQKFTMAAGATKRVQL